VILQSNGWRYWHWYGRGLPWNGVHASIIIKTLHCAEWANLTAIMHVNNTLGFPPARPEALTGFCPRFVSMPPTYQNS